MKYIVTCLTYGHAKQSKTPCEANHQKQRTIIPFITKNGRKEKDWGLTKNFLKFRLNQDKLELKPILLDRLFQLSTPIMHICYVLAVRRFASKVILIKIMCLTYSDKYSFSFCLNFNARVIKNALATRVHAERKFSPLCKSINFWTFFFILTRGV